MMMQLSPTMVVNLDMIESIGRELGDPVINFTGGTKLIITHKQEEMIMEAIFGDLR